MPRSPHRSPATILAPALAAPPLVALILVALILVAPAARAADAGVVIYYESDEHLEVARRLASELSSEGYSVELHDGPATDPSPCDSAGQTLAALGGAGKAWIRLAPSSSDPSALVADICYLGALPFLQRAAPSGPRSDPRRLALATAEALNGLRSKLPATSPEPAQPARVERAEPTRPPPSASIENSFGFGVALLANLPDFPASSGIQPRATLGITPAVALSLDALFPTAGRELSSVLVTATVRTAWLRLGPRFTFTLSDFAVSGSVLAGPSLTWVTGTAWPPRAGSADVAASAVISLAAGIEYPNRGPTFAWGSVAASALLPQVQVDLADGDAPRAGWPIEGAIGLGVRWGGR